MFWLSSAQSMFNVLYVASWLIMQMTHLSGPRPSPLVQRFPEGWEKQALRTVINDWKMLTDLQGSQMPANSDIV